MEIHHDKIGTLTMEWFLAYLILGAVAGFLAGLFGVGGGLVLGTGVAADVRCTALHSRTPDASRTRHCMATILFTSIAACAKHHQHGAVNWQVVRHITPASCSAPPLVP